MSEALQSILVVVILAAAVGYVARRSWRALTGRKQGGCHGCSGCGASSVRVP